MINGITFDARMVRARDDGIVRSKIFGDGILTGCNIAYSGKNLTIGAGYFIVAGRLIEVTSPETIPSDTTAPGGYGRLRFVVDLTVEPSETAFAQYRWEWDYNTVNSGWPSMWQNDINSTGTVYEIVMAVVSFSASNISGVVAKLPALHVGSYLIFKTLTAAGWSSNQQVINAVEIYSASAPGDVRIAQSASDAQFEAWNKAQPRVVSQAVGSITIKITGDVPAVDIPVVLEVR